MDTLNWILPMDFHNRLSRLRKERGLTQQAIADKISLHVSQIKRYEAATAQPTLDTLVRLANALRISLDELVFDDNEMKLDDKIKRLFDAVDKLDNDEKTIISELIDGMIVKYEVKRLAKAAP